jgi:hypothetical protein
MLAKPLVVAAAALATVSAAFAQTTTKACNPLEKGAFTMQLDRSSANVLY